MHGETAVGHAADPALIVALTLLAGVVAQALARHLRMPGIVLLLGTGVLLGPDGAGLIRPTALGGALHALIGFAVAVILFDGGLNLHLGRMRRQALPIRLLLSVGVVITSLGGAAAVKLVLGWGWTASLLFGTLVIVTGPTVITPLLRRIRVKRSVETILESEGVLIDAVGAVIAVVALEFVVASGHGAAKHLLGLPAGLLGGLAIGAAGGAILAFLLNRERLVPEGFANILTLGFVLALFQASNALVPESGIAAAIAAGFVVGNVRHHGSRELRSFKEQLTVLLIGLLFVLLAADVRMADVAALGGRGLLVTALLMFVVRPLNVVACTAGSDLTLREKGFLAWVAPRGIVAAAVATLFAERLEAAGLEGGGDLRALVFLVIATTVVFQGATAGVMARLLRVRRPTGRGYTIIGAQALGRELGRLLRDADLPVVMVDASADMIAATEKAGLRSVFGNALEETILLRAAVDTRLAVVSVSTSEKLNLMAARQVIARFKGIPTLVGVQSGDGSVEPSMAREAGARVLFGDEVDLELWNVRARRGTAAVEAWRCDSDGATFTETVAGNLALPLARDRKGRRAPVHDGETPAKGDVVHWLVEVVRADDARARLREHGWIPHQEDVS